MPSEGGPRAARVVAQAKINLFLRILAREASGYHQLETLFCRLDLGDVVTVRAGGRERTLHCHGPAMPRGGLGPVEANLAHRAAAAYAEAAGWPDGWSIDVEKHIPVGGGLGGGSADAGAVLRVLDALAPRPLGRARLLELAATLGSDVPFLTSEAPLALAWGRGERLLPLPPLPAAPVELAFLEAGVPTRDAYGWLAESRREAPAAPGRQIAISELTRWDAVAEMAENAFESVVCPRYPEIGTLLDEWRGTAGPGGAGQLALMSGSGSTVFRVGALPTAPYVSRVSYRSRETATSTYVVPVRLIE